MPHDDPVEQIQILLTELKARGLLAPICLSTITSEGFPNSRFVDLKGIRDGRFLFGTDGRSVKAQEFTRNSRVAFAAWWEPLQVQVRVQGTVSVSDAKTSDRIFGERSRSAQALATVSNQSGPVSDLDDFRRSVSALVQKEGELRRPSHWNVYEISPDTVEILRFSNDRIHLRTKYEKEPARWKAALLYP